MINKSNNVIDNRLDLDTFLDLASENLSNKFWKDENKYSNNEITSDDYFLQNHKFWTLQLKNENN